MAFTWIIITSCKLHHLDYHHSVQIVSPGLSPLRVYSQYCYIHKIFAKIAIIFVLQASSSKKRPYHLLSHPQKPFQATIFPIYSTLDLKILKVLKRPKILKVPKVPVQSSTPAQPIPHSTFNIPHSTLSSAFHI